jgi:hypothetical protein
MWCIGEHLNIKKNKLQKISFKNSFACKSFFGEKDMKSFSKVIPLIPSYKFWPRCHELHHGFLCVHCHEHNVRGGYP